MIWVKSWALICHFIRQYLIHLLPYSIHRFWISNDNGIGSHDEYFVNTTSILSNRSLCTNNYSENYFMVQFNKVEILNCEWIGFFTSVFLLIGFYLQISIEMLNFYMNHFLVNQQEMSQKMWWRSLVQIRFTFTEMLLMLDINPEIGALLFDPFKAFD